MFNAENFKCRASSLHKIMSESKDNPKLTELQVKRLYELEMQPNLTKRMQEEMATLRLKRENSKKVVLSDTCVDYLMEWYAWETEKIERITKELDILQIEKGKIVEPMSFVLLNMIEDGRFTPNTDKIRLNNDFLSGELDGFSGKDIYNVDEVLDIKSIWDYPTYLCKLRSFLSPANRWQIKAYLDLTNASKGFIADTLVSTPQYVVDKLKWQLLNKCHAATEEEPIFKAKWSVLERSMYFDHIPIHKRVNKKYVDKMSDHERTNVYDRVKQCREYLNNFHEEYEQQNLK
jgi:hypothetical protein